jgi:signal transduction histidine kinase
LAKGESTWRELDDAARAFTEAASRGVSEAASMSNATDLVPRLFQTVELLTSLVADGQRAAVERQFRELVELAELKSAFLRMTAHELRRPLGLVYGHLSLMEGGTFGPVSEDMRSRLQQMGGWCQDMEHLIENLTMVARLEDGAHALDRRPVRLGELVTEAARAVELQSRAKGISIQEQLPDPDVTAHVDHDRMRIAVLNLLGNAVKYAPESSDVRVVVGERDDALTIAVMDEGPGIDEAEQDRVFEIWHRSSGDGTSGLGLGLGLYIVRLVVQLHGGDVELESEVGRGSTFRLVLPKR